MTWQRSRLTAGQRVCLTSVIAGFVGSQIGWVVAEVGDIPGVEEVASWACPIAGVAALAVLVGWVSHRRARRARVLEFRARLVLAGHRRVTLGAARSCSELTAAAPVTAAAFRLDGSPDRAPTGRRSA